VVGNYKIGPETFRIFFYEKLRKKINIYQVNLRDKKVDGPKYLNVDFIQNKIDLLNSMVNIEESSGKPKNPGSIENFQSPKMTKYEELISKIKSKNSGQNQVDLSEIFKIKLMTLNNYFYDSEVLLVFDGSNVYKYIEDKKNK
jgi:hypothetical protein